MEEVTVKPFAPVPGATTLRATAGTATGAAVIPFNITPNIPANDLRARKRSVRIFNAGIVTVFVSFGAASGAGAALATVPVAGGTAGSMPVGPGQTEVFEGISATHAALITESSTADVFITPGEGI